MLFTETLPSLSTAAALSCFCSPSSLSVSGRSLALYTGTWRPPASTPNLGPRGGCGCWARLEGVTAGLLSGVKVGPLLTSGVEVEVVMVGLLEDELSGDGVDGDKEGLPDTPGGDWPAGEAAVSPWPARTPGQVHVAQ